MQTVVSSLACLIALTIPALGATDNIRGFSFAPYLDGPELIAADLSGRPVGIFADCHT